MLTNNPCPSIFIDVVGSAGVFSIFVEVDSCGGFFLLRTMWRNSQAPIEANEEHDCFDMLLEIEGTIDRTAAESMIDYLQDMHTYWLSPLFLANEEHDCFDMLLEIEGTIDRTTAESMIDYLQDMHTYWLSPLFLSPKFIQFRLFSGKQLGHARPIGKP
ncbi:hypothetical protein Tco_0162380 [Tanacetum coccineum]